MTDAELDPSSDVPVSEPVAEMVVPVAKAAAAQQPTEVPSFPCRAMVRGGGSAATLAIQLILLARSLYAR